MRTSVLFILAALLCSQAGLQAQCLPLDAHNTSLTGLWVSCETSTNQLTGEQGHWIRYQFNQVEAIDEIQMWNINHPEYLDYGAREIEIHISEDGVVWTSLGVYELERAPAADDYVGEVISGLEPFEAEYIHLSMLSNHGANCVGLAEVKFTLGQKTTSTIEESLAEEYLIAPNPANDEVTLYMANATAQVNQIRVIDMLGRTALQRPVRSEDRVRIETASLTDGHYVMEITTDQGLVAKPLIVVHPN
ncbi:MAG: T9SS type A sorting domain-containing protein [Bacteroidota bacterium]